MNSKHPITQRHVKLHNDVKQITVLTDFVTSIAREGHLDSSAIQSLVLAMEEAVVNVLMYAYPEKTVGIVDVQATLYPDSIEFTVTDTGKPFDPTAAPPADISLGLEERPVGGLGIHLVRTIMDSVRYSREGGRNILKLTKNIQTWKSR